MDEDVFAILVMCLSPFLLIGVVLLLVFRVHETIGLKPLIRCFEGIELHETPQPGDVYFVYHTYRGLLLFFIQEEHHVLAPPDDAQRLLGRLLKFNLTWGMLSYGILFVPLLAVGNYFSQKRSISKQIRKYQQPESSGTTSPPQA